MAAVALAISGGARSAHSTPAVLLTVEETLDAMGKAQQQPPTRRSV